MLASSETVPSSVLLFFFLFVLAIPQLTTDFYTKSCPKLHERVRTEVRKAIEAGVRMAVSLLRLHFHDCFINGCSFCWARGSRWWTPSRATWRAVAEGSCLAPTFYPWLARGLVLLSGGPTLNVLVGRKDGMATNQMGANNGLPSPFVDIDIDIIDSKFATVGLNIMDVVALSVGHMDRQGKNLCPVTGNGNNTALLDRNSIYLSDNRYFKNLLATKGILGSDQLLYSGDNAAAAVLPLKPG